LFLFLLLFAMRRPQPNAFDHPLAEDLHRAGHVANFVFLEDGGRADGGVATSQALHERRHRRDGARDAAPMATAKRMPKTAPGAASSARVAVVVEMVTSVLLFV
jgi:hypothetical protein